MAHSIGDDSYFEVRLYRLHSLHCCKLSLMCRIRFLMLTLAAVCGNAQTKIYIPQVADGGGWQTTIVVTTTTPAGAVVTSNCFQDGIGGSTASWVPVQRVANLNASVGTLFLKSQGAADLVTTGWCEL